MTIAPARTTPALGLPAPQPRPRQAWVDVARGFVVVMVVVMHLGIYHFLPMTTGESSNAFWTEVNSVLQVLRMPSLLILSGWLASSRVRAGLGSARTRRTIAANAYLYVLWLAIYAAAAVALGATEMAQAPTPQTFLPELLMPYSTLWFLAALAWYTAGLAALRRVPAPVVLTGLFALGWLSTNLWPVEMGLWANIPHMAIYFAIGVYAKPAIEAIGARPALALAGGVGSAVMLGEIAGTLQEGGLPTYPLVVAQSLAGVAAVFGAASLATRDAAPLTKPLAWLGRRTLSIYALHYLAIMAVSTVASGRLYDLDRALLASPTGRWVYPLVATAAIVLAAVAVHEAAQHLGLRWLFAMPHRPAALARRTADARARVARRIDTLAPIGYLASHTQPEPRVPDDADFAEVEELPPRLTLVPVG
ncbi:MAG: acyltransferase family protein [Austwickia sp.]|nr:MAG: acyltransferase family protein [Austwickia sp.]